MFKTKNELREIRKNLAKQMHNYILELGDEDIYETWILVMPDEPTEDDFDWFGDAEEFKDLCETFGKLVHKFWKEG